MNDLSFWTGIIGGIAGLMALYDRWCDRKPQLRIFAPYNFTGIDAQTENPVLSIFLRISNSSRASAFLYLETMSVELFYDGSWVRTKRLDPKPGALASTDLPEEQQVAFGITEAPFLTKFGATLVTIDNPLCGYVVVSHSDRRILSGFSRIRVAVNDCHLHNHCVTIDLQEQKRKHDPNGKTAA